MTHPIINPPNPFPTSLGSMYDLLILESRDLDLIEFEIIGITNKVKIKKKI